MYIHMHALFSPHHWVDPKICFLISHLEQLSKCKLKASSVQQKASEYQLALGLLYPQF